MNRPSVDALSGRPTTVQPGVDGVGAAVAGSHSFADGAEGAGIAATAAVVGATPAVATPAVATPAVAPFVPPGVSAVSTDDSPSLIDGDNAGAEPAATTNGAVTPTDSDVLSIQQRIKRPPDAPKGGRKELTKVVVASFGDYDNLTTWGSGYTSDRTAFFEGIVRRLEGGGRRFIKYVPDVGGGYHYELMLPDQKRKMVQQMFNKRPSKRRKAAEMEKRKKAAEMEKSKSAPSLHLGANTSKKGNEGIVHVSREAPVAIGQRNPTSAVAPAPTTNACKSRCKSSTGETASVEGNLDTGGEPLPTTPRNSPPSDHSESQKSSEMRVVFANGNRHSSPSSSEDESSSDAPSLYDNSR